MTSSTPEDLDPRAAVKLLTDGDRVRLIGVRHHSPVLAAAIPAMLDAAEPDAVLVELPAEMQPWLTWLAHPETVAPVALAAAHPAGDGALSFYPFADFSPELAALRWARRHGVPAYCCDLPLADPAWAHRAPTPAQPGGCGTLSATVRAALTGRADDDLWDRWVEAAAPGSPPEAVRTAALAAGWALRHDAQHCGGVPELDLRREAWMRQRIAATPGRLAVVVGAFHTPALVGSAQADATAPDPPSGDAVVSLVPYTFDLLDARSGYPAGIRDPQWQQAVFESNADPVLLDQRVRAFAVQVVRAVRAQGHPAGPAEAAEAARLAGDLARLRDLPAAGRGELVEALQTVLAQGEPVGRGRSVARAMQQTLVGERRGRLAAGAPVGGLRPAVTAQFAQLRLPGAGDAAQTMRLDPLRSPRDRAREVTLRRLAACTIAYGTCEQTSAAGGTDPLTTVWRLQWTPATDAGMAVAALHGVTLEQAAAGMLTARRLRELDSGGPTAAQALEGLDRAAGCGLAGLVETRLDDVRSAVCHGGTLDEIVSAIRLLQKLERGHHPALTPPPLAERFDDLYAAGVAAVAGLTGSTRVEDARALLNLTQHADAAGRHLRLRHTLTSLARDGSPLMRGAAGATCVLLGFEEPGPFGARLASWIHLSGAECTGRLRGAMTIAGALLQAGGATMTPLLDAIDELDDEAFVRRLPALRGGFDALSPADRDRLLHTLTARHGDLDTRLDTDPAILADWIAADRVGLAAVTALGLLPNEAPEPAADTGSPPTRPAVTAGTITADQRWRLLLGREADKLPPHAHRLATALDELYGAGRGEGAYTVGGGAGGGKEPAYPEVRDWLEDVSALFGDEVRDEVLARAAEAGRVDALLAADPDRVRPSMDLLHTVLALAGSLPETRLTRLRPLVARLVADLTAQLARRIRPALTGLGTPRRTRRPTGRLDLAGTLHANLHTVRRDATGRPQVLPERPIFLSRGRRSVDWQVVLLVDVSGSMEQSTIWAALTASVLAGVPSLRTHFVTFATDVIDMTDRVNDPLSLLLEVRVGGGTHIAAALRYARQITTTPSRTMVVVISDFEEGYPLGGLLAATRALVDDGVALLGCASLDDRGQPRYSTGIASQLVAAGMPVAALSPTALARWIAERVR